MHTYCNLSDETRHNLTSNLSYSSLGYVLFVYVTYLVEHSFRVSLPCLLDLPNFKINAKAFSYSIRYAQTINMSFFYCRISNYRALIHFICLFSQHWFPIELSSFLNFFVFCFFVRRLGYLFPCVLYFNLKMNTLSIKTIFQKSFHKVSLTFGTHE